MFQRLRTLLRDYMDRHIVRAARTAEILERLETLTRLQAYMIDRLNEEAGHMRKALATPRDAALAAADKDAANTGIATIKAANVNAARGGMAHDRV